MWALPEDSCPEGKLILSLEKAVDETDCRVRAMGSQCFAKDTLYKTVQESALAGTGIELLLFSLGV